MQQCPPRILARFLTEAGAARIGARVCLETGQEETPASAGGSHIHATGRHIAADRWNDCKSAQVLLTHG